MRIDKARPEKIWFRENLKGDKSLSEIPKSDLQDGDKAIVLLPENRTGFYIYSVKTTRCDEENDVKVDNSGCWKRR
jgi:hypothetical protein